MQEAAALLNHLDPVLTDAFLAWSMQEVTALFQHLNRSQAQQDQSEPCPLLDGWAADRAMMRTISGARRTNDCASRSGVSAPTAGTTRTVSGAAPGSADDLMEYLGLSCASSPSRTPPLACPDGSMEPPSRNASPPPQSSPPTSLGLLRMCSRRRASGVVLAEALAAYAAAASSAASRRNSLLFPPVGGAASGGCGAVLDSRGGSGGRGSANEPPLAPAPVSRPASPTSAAQARYLRELLGCDESLVVCGSSRSCVFSTLARRPSTPLIEYLRSTTLPRERKGSPKE